MNCMCRLATLLHSQLIHNNESNELQDMEEIQYFLMYIVFLSGPISFSLYHSPTAYDIMKMPSPFLENCRPITLIIAPPASLL
jgi:hypothetical protein